MESGPVVEFLEGNYCYKSLAIEFLNCSGYKYLCIIMDGTIYMCVCMCVWFPRELHLLTRTTD
jgi:hypothetical protein